MKYEVFIALGDSAEAYAENFDVHELERAINDDYAPSLVRRVFDTKEQKQAFQDGLEFCSEECGTGNFFVIDEDDVNKNRELIESLTL